ncbi:hypothetical protein BUALT_Bualt15G0107300 [Buddleja alternifolia]|uniref:X8 domain-containing protein n=1 Tax=Buddleja alternifolia TaxID=168488 RepID=A0AAV6WPV0_9LAMI|nr:hypothetical protein BUALT_Bualt15G0107300 [Buddleja alternifolia]
MDTTTTPPNSLFLFLVSIFIVCSTGTFSSHVKNLKQRELPKEVVIKTIEHDSFPMTNYPTTSTLPPDTPNPQIITVPSTSPPTPTTLPPTTPLTNPTNPVTTPTTNTPQGPPLTNPATPTGGVPVTTPVMPPPATPTNTPTGQGQSWCVAKSGAPEASLQAALDYSCGIGRVDCSAIQQGASCYNPNTLQNHASYAFNTYYQRNPVQTSCDFGGSATVTNVNPSSGSCIFSTSSSSTSPTTTNPTTSSSSGATPIGSGTPSMLNGSNPDLGGATTGYGDGPTSANGSSFSMSSSLQPFISCVIVIASFITREFVLGT